MSQSSLGMSLLTGVAVSAACALVWALSARWARHGDSRWFMTAHLGGMTVRLALAGGLSAWAMLKLNLQIGAFVLALLVSYTVLMVVEVIWLARRQRLSAGTRQ